MLKREHLWDELINRQTQTFKTSQGLPFTYRIHGGEMIISRKSRSITRATVYRAYEKAAELHGLVPGPKRLGTFGASYLYPVFQELGLIRREENPPREPSPGKKSDKREMQGKGIHQSSGQSSCQSKEKSLDQKEREERLKAELNHLGAERERLERELERAREAEWICLGKLLVERGITEADLRYIFKL